MKKLDVSIREIMMNFKGALTSLIPWLVKSNIPYKEGEAYDEWDAISSAVFEAIVISPITYSLRSEKINTFARYDFHYSHYRNLDFILCEKPSEQNDLVVFVSYIAEEDFDVLNVCNLSGDTLEVISRSKMKISNARFFVNREHPTDIITLEG